MPFAATGMQPARSACLFAFLVLSHDRRQLLWVEVTRQRRPSGWRDRSPRHFPGHQPPAWCGTTTVPTDMPSRVRAIGIRDRPISRGSPWQNAYVERLIGTVRRGYLDRLLTFGEAH